MFCFWSFSCFPSLPPPAGRCTASRTRRIRAGCTPPCRATPAEARTATVRQWVSSNSLSSFHLISPPSAHPTGFSALPVTGSRDSCSFSHRRQRWNKPNSHATANARRSPQCKVWSINPVGVWGGGGCVAGICAVLLRLWIMQRRDSSVYARRGPVLLLLLHGFLIVRFVPYSIFKHFISCACRCRFM